MVDDLAKACDFEKIIVLLLRDLTLCQINIKWKLCAKTFSLSNMGEQSLKSHAAGKKHIAVETQHRKLTQ